MKDCIVVSESVRCDIEARLEDCKRRIYTEIKNYPSPITACDQQFNYLLEQQTQIQDGLARWRAIFEQRRDDGALRELIAEFVRSSNYLDEATKERVSAGLAQTI
jgi:hypothetical protein